MAYVLKQIYNFYHYYLVEYTDTRSMEWPLVQNPLLVLGIALAYLYFVLTLGPKWMQNRPAFQLKNVLIVYNTFQIAANLLVWIYVVRWTYFSGTFNLVCNAPSYRDDDGEIGRNQVFATYLYFLLKLLDLFDTIFFVLAKKFTHVTFLHVYHHFGMVIGIYVAVRFLPAGHGTMLGVLNCLVHCVMYGYYLCSALSEDMKRSLWWKKYITQIQILQFLLLSVHFALPFIMSSCKYPIPICSILSIQNIFMLSMFGDFYRKAYLRKKTN